MFGAKGDGVADDTNAIQSMFDSKASVIFFPKGIYNISKTITITTSCSIKGCSPHSFGSTRLKYVGTEGNKSLIYIENVIVSIEDIEIHGSSCSVKNLIIKEQTVIRRYIISMWKKYQRLMVLNLEKMFSVLWLKMSHYYNVPVLV